MHCIKSVYTLDCMYNKMLSRAFTPWALIGEFIMNQGIIVIES